MLPITLSLYLIDCPNDLLILFIQLKYFYFRKNLFNKINYICIVINLPNARPNITTLISVDSKKNLTVTHSTLSALPPTLAAALTVIDTTHLITDIITLHITSP